MASSALSSRIQGFLGLLSRIRTSDVFDSAFYRRQSFGARLSPAPLIHYMFVGWRQGLNPSPRFDTRFYIERYRDVRESGSNPLTHYMVNGREEGRLATRSGRIFRESLYPDYAPLPVFGAPAGATPRLSVVIDDNTPVLLGVGYMPLLGLAIHTAHQAGWSLRIVIRSHTISTASISAALNSVASGPRPTIDISRRTPGPTDDVDTTPTDIWWASSASSMESLRGLIDPSTLWWVMSADEASRVAAGEHREAVTHLLGHKETKVIALGDTVARVLPKARVALTVTTLPTLVPLANDKKASALGVLVDPDQAECLAATATQVVEHALTHGTLASPVTLLGLDWEALTLSGSVVVNQVKPASAEEWSIALGTLQRLLIVQAGSEHPWLAQQSAAQGLAVVSGSGSVSDIASALGKARAAKPAASPDWATVVTPVRSLVEKARG